MPKAKPANTNKGKPSASAKSGKPTPKSVKSSTSEKKPATTAASSEFTGIAIGHAAGEVWGVLSSAGPRTIAEIKKSVQAPPDVVVAALGWLAREHKLEFVTSGRAIKIGLR